jgi:acyl-CoA synthetase (AMP-forming)/AMP-acid ligase II
MNLITIFEQKVATQPSTHALLGFEGKSIASYSYEVLDSKVNAMAKALQFNGIKAGDKVVLFTPARLDLFVLLLAVFKLGAVCVFIDPSFSGRQIYQCISDAGADYVIACPEAFFLFWLFPPAACRVLNAAELIKFSHTMRTESGSTLATAWVADEAPALMTFTSGSSGRAKCLIRSHGFLMMQSHVLTVNLARAGRCLELTTLPIFVLNNLALGVPSFLAETRQPPKRTIDALKKCKVSSILCAPDFLGELSSELKRTQTILPFLEEVTVGGGPVFPAILEQAHQVFPNAKLQVVYGSSEVEPISILEVTDLEHYTREAKLGKGLLVGREAQGTEVLIAKSQLLNRQMLTVAFNKALQACGSYGEILVAAKHSLCHYGRNSNVIASNKVLVDGKLYHRTGDAGYFDQDGLLHYLGPVKGELALSGNQPCFTTQIEAAFLACFGEAKRAALDPQTLVLYVELYRGANLPNELRFWALPAVFSHAFKIKTLKNIPVDKRHYSKILYQRLPKENRLSVTNSRLEFGCASEKAPQLNSVATQ